MSLSPLAITQSDALVFVSAEESPIQVWDQVGKPMLVARKVARIGWSHVETEQLAGATLAGFDVVLFQGASPDANRVADLVTVGRSIRSTEIVFAPLQSITAKAAVRARYSTGTVSAWTELPGSISVQAQVWPLGGGARSTILTNVGSVAAGATGTASVEVPKTFSVLKASTNFPARVRLYQTAADLAADASRSVDDDPTGDHGCLLEVVTDSRLLSIRLSPVATGTRRDDGTTAFLAVQNLDSEARIMSVTLEFLSLE